MNTYRVIAIIKVSKNINEKRHLTVIAETKEKAEEEIKEHYEGLEFLQYCEIYQM